MIAAVLLLLQQPVSWIALTREFDAYARQDGVVGATIALIENGRVSQGHYFGFQDLETRRPIDEHTIYHWASITKTLNAVAIMQLRDRGLLSLDDPITRWVPELRQLHNPHGNTDAITLRMALGHSAGFRGGTWPYSQGRSWEPFEPARWEQLVAMMPYQEVLFAPDARYSYSNPAFIYTARVVEAITGDPWQSYIYKNLWIPLGMMRSYFNRTPWHLIPYRSNNYTAGPGYREPNDPDTIVRYGPRPNGFEFDPGITIPNGGWNAPIGDLAKWLGFLTGSAPGADSILARHSLEEMWRSRFPVSGYDGGADSMGLSFFIYGTGGERLIGHTGDQAGFRSFFLINPRTRRGVAAVFNTATNDNTAASSRGFGAIQAAAMRLLRER